MVLFMLASKASAFNPYTYESQKSSNTKRDVLVGDLSYSYSATDFGAANGSHIKTITVIKNYAVPKPKVNRDSKDKGDLEKHRFTNNNFKVVVKLPEIPEIFDDYYVHTEQFTENHPSPAKVPNRLQPSPSSAPSPATSDSNTNMISTAVIRQNNMPDEIIVGTNKEATRNSASMGLSESIPQDVEIIAGVSRGEIKRKPQFMVEDFSDYSMHNVKHLTDMQQKPKKTYTNIDSDSNQQFKESKRVIKPESNTPPKSRDVPKLLEKSQSYLDISHESDQEEYFGQRMVETEPIVKSLSLRSRPQQASYEDKAPTPSNLKYFDKLPSEATSTVQTPYIAPVKRRFSSQVRNAPKKPRVIPTHEYHEQDTPYDLNTYKIARDDN